jgi:hypothetical protein
MYQAPSRIHIRQRRRPSSVRLPLYSSLFSISHIYFLLVCSGVDDDFDAINKALTAVLVLHPIVCALTFVTLVVSLFILRRGTNGLSARLPSLITLGFGVITAILTTVVFLVDVIFVAVVRSSVHRLSEGNLTLVWGNAVWMTLGATISTWLAICGACGGVIIGRRR